MCKRVIEYIKRVVIEIAKIFGAYCSDVPPEYEPERWNDGGTIQDCNNCYNYACNLQTNTFAQPGYESGSIYSTINCQEVKNGAISDGLKPISSNEECKTCSHRVALVIDPDWPDFHWYRQDRNGMWSHKPGTWSVRNYDNAGNSISDPRTANRGDYSIFCGFFCVYKGDVKINGYGCPG